MIENEIFGPILTINSFNNYSDAVNISNKTSYGLSAVICGKNQKRNLDIANKLEAGRVWINEDISHNYACLPVGGFKESGLGKECGEDAIKRYSEIKSIILNK